MDLGQTRRGVDMGPSAVRYAGLQPRLERLGYDVIDAGNINVRTPEEAHNGDAVTKIDGARVRHLEAVRSACAAIYATAAASIDEHEFPIFLGGDHSIALGTVGRRKLVTKQRASLDRRPS